MKRWVCLTWLFVAWLGIACQGPRVVVEVDERSRSGWGPRSVTWDWAPRPLASVQAPEGDAELLRAQLAREVASALEARGFVHSRLRPAVYVTFRLEVKRTRVTRVEVRPAKRISGSLIQGHFEVHPGELREREFDDAELVIGVARADSGEVVWLARVKHRFRDRFEPHLESTLARVFERLPEAPSLTASADTAPGS